MTCLSLLAGSCNAAGGGAQGLAASPAQGQGLEQGLESEESSEDDEEKEESKEEVKVEEVEEVKPASPTSPANPEPAVPPEEETEWGSFEKEVNELPSGGVDKEEPKEVEVEEVPVMERDKMCLTAKTKAKPPEREYASSGEWETVQGWKKQKKGTSKARTLQMMDLAIGTSRPIGRVGEEGLTGNQ